MKGSAARSGRVEEYRQGVRAAEGRTFDDGRRRIGVETQVWQAIEKRAQPDPELEPGQVHPQTQVGPGAEGDMVDTRPVDIPILPACDRIHRCRLACAKALGLRLHSGLGYSFCGRQGGHRL